MQLTKKNLLVALILFMTLVSCTKKPEYTLKEDSNVDNATLIILAYPEEIVRSTPSFYSKLLPYVGMGIPGRIRAGHACMVLIKDGSETFEYYDFGRYITPDGYSRVRSSETDPETTVDVKAEWRNNKISNIKELLVWLYDHPEKTRGYGDLYASVSEKVNYERVKEYIGILQEEGLMTYGPFVPEGSNCARFVTGAMYHGIVDKNLFDRIEDQYMITPSGLGNVYAGNSYPYYYVVNEDTVLKGSKDLEQLQRSIIFDWGEDYPKYSPEGSLVPPSSLEVPSDWQWLGGIGSGAWFEIEPTSKPDLYYISHYNSKGGCEYATLYKSQEDFCLKGDGLRVTYPSNFQMITLANRTDTIHLQKIPNAKRFVRPVQE